MALLVFLAGATWTRLISTHFAIFTLERCAFATFSAFIGNLAFCVLMLELLTTSQLFRLTAVVELGRSHRIAAGDPADDDRPGGAAGTGNGAVYPVVAGRVEGLGELGDGGGFTLDPVQLVMRHAVLAKLSETMEQVLPAHHQRDVGDFQLHTKVTEVVLDDHTLFLYGTAALRPRS